jgi:two-component sensor histidine kinase
VSLALVSSPSNTERRLTAEIEDLKQIHGLGLRLGEASTLSEGLMDVLRTAVQLVEAGLGSVQLLNADGQLEMIGQIGFGADILDKFAVVTLQDCSTCAVALNRRARVVVRDLRKDPDFTQIAASLRSYGAVGAVSTPILDKAGKVLAMFSVYWLEAHQPDDRELAGLDLCAELAGRHVERSVAARAVFDHEQRQTLLMRELAHRGKNLLQVIQSIARRSLSGERTLDEAREVFIGRLAALSNTYSTLTEESPESLPLTNVITAGLQSHGERINVRGPAISVPAKKAQTLSLVIHELATNAAKYGALSVPTGRVEVAWGIASGQFFLKWSEIDGPAVQPPTRAGFGSVIITSVIGGELNCKPTLEYRQSGFQYHLDCPYSVLTASGN